MQQEIPCNLIKHNEWQKACDLYRHDLSRFYHDVLGVDMTWQQAMLFTSLAHDGSRTSLASGQWGFNHTRSAAISGLWHLCFFPESLSIFLHPKANHFKKLIWKEIEICLDQMRKGKLAWLADYVHVLDEAVFIKDHQKTWHLCVKTSLGIQPQQVACASADNLMIWVNHAAKTDDAILEVLTGALVNPNQRMSLISDPTKITGFFYDTHHKLSLKLGGVWNAITFNAEESPLVSNSMLKEALLKYGSRNDEQYKIHILGQFPSTSLNAID
jgi:hypothetical protein